MHVVAVLGSDLHMSQTAPVARSAEPDWLLAQLRYLRQVSDLLQKYNVPFIVAGDVFHKWYAPVTTPELINFLICAFPRPAFTIPGQHDLPDHRWADRGRSPYWTLVLSGVVRSLEPGRATLIGDDIAAHAFPWGFPVKPLGESRIPGRLNLAVVHSYIWVPEHSYPGAPQESHADNYRGVLRDYDCAVFGDNHKGFMLGTRVMNCGTFIRRASDERSYRPMVGLLYSDGHIQPHYLDTSADLWLEELGNSETKSTEFQADDFINSVREISPDSLDFQTAVTHRLDQINASVEVRGIVSGVLA